MQEEILLRVLSCKRSGKTSGVVLNMPMGNPATNPPKYGTRGEDLFDVIFETDDGSRIRYLYESRRYYSPMEIQRARKPTFFERLGAEKLVEQKSGRGLRLIFSRP